MGRPWSDEEIQFIDENKDTLTNDEIATALERTKSAVENVIFKCGLQRDDPVVSKMRGAGMRQLTGENSPFWRGGEAANKARYYTNHREEIIERNMEYYRSNPKRAYAKHQANRAVRTGKLKIKPCEWIDEKGRRCNATKDIHKHHKDYSKGLDVTFYCCKHHAKRHTEIRAERIKKQHEGLNLEKPAF